MALLELPTIASHGPWSHLSKKFFTQTPSELYVYAHAQIHLRHRPLVYKQLNSKRIKVERPESNRRPERDSVSFPLAYIPHNPETPG